LQKARFAYGVAIALAGLTLAVVATYLPLWSASNRLVGSPIRSNPTIPSSFYEIWSGVTWWSVLGPDEGEKIHLLTALLVTWAPVGIVVMSAILPLMVKRLRPSFGPAVLVAVAMWGGQVLMWAALSNDNHSFWQLKVGGYLLFAGLVTAAIGAVWDVAQRPRASTSIS
jgi:hypothetical protein